MTVEFVDELPKSRMGPRNLDPVLVEFAEALRANPNTWAKYPKPARNASSHAFQINTGVVTALKDGFEAACRNHELYVRYVGGAR